LSAKTAETVVGQVYTCAGVAIVIGVIVVVKVPTRSVSVAVYVVFEVAVSV
jgi:hypothetical protein